MRASVEMDFQYYDQTMKRFKAKASNEREKGRNEEMEVREHINK